MVGASLSEELKDRVLELFKDGLSTIDIVRETGVSKSAVNNLTRPYREVIKHNPKERRRLREVALSSYDEGKSVLEIHEVTAVPVRTIQYWIRDYKGEESYSNEDRTEFGRIVDRTLRRLDLTYVDLSRLMNVTPAAAIDYKTGKSIPRGKKRRTLLEILNRDRDKKLETWDDFVREIKSKSKVYS